MKGLKGRIVVVTGAAGGLGSATARRFIAEGSTVIVADINRNGVEDLARELGANAVAVYFDAMSNESCHTLIEDTVARFGRIDVLDNNHAIINEVVTPADTTVVKTPFEIWDQVMAGNVRSYFATCKYAIPHMLKAGGGRIINFSSVSGVLADHTLTAYAASKAAVIALTNSIAAQYGKQNIRCNAVAPGLVVGPSQYKYRKELIAVMLKHGLLPRVGEPDDIASLVAFLASDESAYLQGQLLFCDGGLLRHMPQTADTEGMWS
jgi:NAD(P)-dependent dehydrogenase (short-subunit alcohol dehydrogenase family)